MEEWLLQEEYGSDVERKVREGTYLAVRIVKTLLVILTEDYLLVPFFGRTDLQQLTFQELVQPQVLSGLIQRDVVKVTKGFGTKIDDGATIEEVGAGGTGSSRQGFIAQLRDGTKLRLFAKIPTNNFFERAFLSVFQVYFNEISFYNKIHKHLPQGDTQEDRDFPILPAVYCSKMLGTGKFIIILEDVNFRKNGATFQAILDLPYPKERAKKVLKRLAQWHRHFWIKGDNDSLQKSCWSYSPINGAPQGQTPPFLIIIAEATMKQTLKRFQHTVNMHKDVVEAYFLALRNYRTIRKFWSQPPLTLSFGDCHIGNMFFDKQTDAVGFFDMQCTSAECFIRDVAYHLISSYPEDQLVAEEDELLLYYLDELKLQELMPSSSSSSVYTFEKVKFLYRIHSLWPLLAFVISAGANELMVDETAKYVLTRIFNACHRLNLLDAIRQVVDDENARKRK